MKAYLLKVNKRHSSTYTPTIPLTAGIEVKFKEGTSIEAPSLLLQMDDTIFDYNYVVLEIGGINRFYFVDQCVIVAKELYRLDCSMDYLATYRNEIIQNKCFVQYAQGTFDDSIPDTRLSTSVYVDRPSDVVGPIFSGILSSTGQFVVEVVTYPTSQNAVTTGGLTTVAILNVVQAQELRKNLMTDNDIISAVKKSLTNAYESVTRCMWIPFSAHSATTVNLMVSNGSTNFDLLNDKGPAYLIPTSDTNAKCLRLAVNLDLTDWSRYGDFRDCEPYTTFNLFLPFVGYVSINPSDVLKDEEYAASQTLKVVAEMDFASGYVTYSVGAIGTWTGKFGVELTVPRSSNNLLNVPSSLIGGGASMAAGNYFGAASGLYSAVVNANTRNLGTSGAYGNRSTIAMASTGTGDFADNCKVRLKIFRHNTTVSPSSVASTMGRPLMRTMTIQDVGTGYIQTLGADIKLNASDTARTTINSMLDSGIWYE